MGIAEEQHFSCMSAVEHEVPSHAESNGKDIQSNRENIKDTMAARELAPSNFYAPQRQNGTASPASEVQEAVTESKGRQRKRSRSESEFSEIDEEDAGSDFDVGDSADSDDSFSRCLPRIMLDIGPFEASYLASHLLSWSVALCHGFLSENTDNCHGRMSRKRRKAEEAQQKRFRMPEDTEMRQKLRGSTLQASLPVTEDDSRAPSPIRGQSSETESLSDEESDPTAGELQQYVNHVTGSRA